MKEATLKKFCQNRKILQDYCLHFEELDSSNNWIIQEAKNLKSGSIVSCDFQRQGKGRMGRTWLAEKKQSAMFSVFYLPPKNFPLYCLSLGIGVALIESLKPLAIAGLSLKWPNDLMIDKKKTGGILCEVFSNQCVLGVGINVHQKEQNFPSEIREKVTSLSLASTQNFCCFSIIEQATYWIDKILYKLERGKQKEIIQSWEKHSSPYKNILYHKKNETQKQKGTIQGIDYETGNLIIKNSLGKIENIVSGEIVQEIAKQ